MTRRQLTDEVIIAVNGGKPSQDNSVQTAEVDIFIQVACNYVNVKYVFGAKAEARAMGEQYKELEGTMLSVFYVDVAKDCDRDLSYSTLPGKIATLPGEMGLSSVGPLKGGEVWHKLKNKNAIAGLQDVLMDVTFYWPENHSGVQRVYYHNMSHLVEKAMVSCLLSISSIGWEEEIPIPVGSELEVIDIATQFFKGERAMPADMLVNNKDDKR